MIDRVPIAIIGGGALGLAVACSLLNQGLSGLVLLEKNEAFGLEQSGSNSGVIHAGFFYETESLMARFCVEGAERLYEFCRNHGVPFKQTGKLMVAVSDHEVTILEKYRELAINNGLREVRMISGKEARKLEPCVNAKAALHVPRSGVFDPAAYVSGLYRYAAALHDAPDMMMRGCNVRAITPGPEGFLIDVTQARGAEKHWQLTCDVLINAAGLHSLDLAKMMDPDLSFEKQYLKGEYCQFNRRPNLFVQMNVYPTPVFLELPGGGTFIDLGAHLTPKVGPDGRGGTLVAGEIQVGPIFHEVLDPNDRRNTMDPLKFYDPVKPFFPTLKKEDLYQGHTGVLGLIKNQTDFMIYRDEKYPNAIHLLGMESPALTASLAIGRYVADMVKI